MKRLINWKFIVTATLTYIPYTVLWFFWHNNMFHSLYYTSDLMKSMDVQNIWAMNFANALLVYGFVYFYFFASPPLRQESFGQSSQKGEEKKEVKLINAVLWGIYYSLSAIGFYSFLNLGMLSSWRVDVLAHDMIFAVVGGAVSGVLVYYLYKRFNTFDRSERIDR